MKRSTFLTSLTALLTVPLLSFKKEETKDVPVKRSTWITNHGDTREPFIIRTKYRASAEEMEHLYDGELEFKEKWIEDMQMKSIMHHIKNCPYLIKKKIVNDDGSMEYHYILSILPR